MTVSYDRQNDGVFVMLWACPKYGTVIEEMQLIRRPKDEDGMDH
jgi:hypothetical protein